MKALQLDLKLAEERIAYLEANQLSPLLVGSHDALTIFESCIKNYIASGSRPWALLFKAPLMITQST